MINTGPLAPYENAREYQRRLLHAMSGFRGSYARWAVPKWVFYSMVIRFRKAVECLFRRGADRPVEPKPERGRQGERKRDRISHGPAYDYKGTLPYPHFIIIGAPKCGTSWLRAALDQHPEVLMLPDDVEYFSDFSQRSSEICVT